ncbi:TrmH family RNA methyltransferase [bacterium]|nr:TrmH family RNA methyltransferase [bacterium]
MTHHENSGESPEGKIGVDPAQYPADAWELLSPSMTEARRERLLRAANNRTGQIRLVVQDIHHPHNVSACLRSAEAFGVADVDVVCLKEKFRPSTVAKGVADWLRIHKFDSIDACVAHLRAKGYVLAAGYPDAKVSMFDLPVDRPVAVVFGNEHEGVAREWRDHIDIPFTIPMVGLVESLNISVSAAVTLNQLTRKARQELGDGRYLLPEAERNALLSAWACRQLRSWETQIENLRARRIP